MHLDSTPESQEEINGTIINVSFPRSGHRFLREILSGYFADNFVFYESYLKKIVAVSQSKNDLRFVNYVKTHDFELNGRNVLLSELPVNRRYLVQIRHPLESIASYYEFSLKHGHIRYDNQLAWNMFLAKKLKYWKRFCEVWLSGNNGDFLLITYDDLCTDTVSAAKRAIRFLTTDSRVNSQKLTKVINRQDFLQYVGETGSKKSSKRNLESFKYFDKNKFEIIEQNLNWSFCKTLWS